MYATFVKKDMSKEELGFYGKVNGYMFLEKTGYNLGESISMAFMAASPDGNAPAGTRILDDEEMRKYDSYCRANNIYPRPFEDEKITETTDSDRTNWNMNSELIKGWLQRKKGMFKV